MNPPTAPRIIIKKKGGHGGHHGGAWKVAYADFVTAMMALFIVLWLLNTSKQTQEAIGGYFRDPTGTSKKVGTDLQGSGENFTLTKDNIPQLKEELQKAIHRVANFEKLSKQIEITVTNEGLRVELLENQKGTFFDIGNAKPSGDGKQLLSLMAEQIGKLPNKVSIEGHTDSKPYGRPDYSNWELSVDRANAARRIMQQGGLAADQVSQVRGFADQRLRNKENPEDPSNRRISIIVHYLDKPQSADDSSRSSEEKSNSEPPALAVPVSKQEESTERK
jgi:chemotaxis protein MotB